MTRSASTNDKMKCPMCGGKLKAGKAEYRYQDVLFGKFDADVCRKCGEAFFTEAASDRIDKIAREKGLWGLERASKVSYSGNSLIVRIPAEIAKFTELERGRDIRIRPEGKKRIVVEL